MREEIVRKLRINREIRAKEVLVIGEAGEQLGTMPLYQAWELANERELDLVEVAPTATPPVCRLLDYGKFKYEQTRKEREARRKVPKVTVIREVRFRPKIGRHDLERKVQMIEKLIDKGYKVKVMVRFRGREVTHPEIAFKLLQGISGTLKEAAAVDRPAVMEGRTMNIILSPIASRKQAEESKVTKEL
mgnify:CR=1 FL=1